TLGQLCHLMQPLPELPLVWPPQPGSTFDTSILSWSFQNQSFWRGNHDLAEVLGENLGETISLRLPASGEVDATCDEDNIALGQSVKFDAALEAYNSHPEVRAHSDKSVDGGAGAISLDNRRKAAAAVSGYADKYLRVAYVPQPDLATAEISLAPLTSALRQREGFDRHTKSAQKSNSRRFSTGRIVVDHAHADANPWLLSSELAVAGRCVAANESERGAPTVMLPKGQELLLPEGASADSDLRLSERVKPSPEQSAAQKGVMRCEKLLTSLFRNVTQVKARPVIVVNFTGYVEEFGAAVLNLRQRGVVDGAGDAFDFHHLYYLSLHLLDNKTSADFAQARVLCECLDCWLAKRMVYAGIAYNDAEASLSEAEMAAIPGSEVLRSVDTLKLKVTIRKGSAVEVHPDQIKQWQAQGGPLSEEFEQLLQRHNATYKDLLATSGVIKDGALTSESQDIVPVDDEAKTDPEPSEAVVTFESLAELEAKDPIKHRSQSEVGDVELLRGNSGQTYLLAKKNKTLPRHTVIAGFGTGKFIPAAVEEEGVAFDYPKGDKTLIQVDHSSISPENTNTEVMSVYRYLVLLERSKKVTKYVMSYSDISRQSENQTDGFSVKVAAGHKYKCLVDNKPRTCKTWFGDSVQQVAKSKILTSVFRFRFERVSAVSKIQKPYVMLTQSLPLEAGKPIQAWVS
ncbi:unnamed protein product, partial [Effrenium voratum]